MSRRSGWMTVIPAVFPCSLLRSADLPLWSECRQPPECARKKTRVTSARRGLLKTDRMTVGVLDLVSMVDIVSGLRSKLGRARCFRRLDGDDRTRAPRGGHCQGHARDGWGHSGHSRYRPGRAREIGWRPGARAA